MMDIAAPQTMELMYGAPEYGGNRDLVGWGFTRFAGDTLPRGWTDEEVEQGGPPGPALAEPAGLPLGPAVALGSPENALATATSGTTRLSTATDVVARALGTARR